MLACLSRRRSRVQIPSRALSTKAARYANRQSGQAQTLVICGFDSRLRHLNTCVGWASASPTACKAASPQGYAGSTPARRTFDSARSSIGIGYQTLDLERRVQFPHGLLNTTMWRNWQTRDAQNVVPQGMGVRLSPWSLTHCRRGRCPTGSHKAGVPGSIPGPATEECCGWA